MFPRPARPFGLTAIVRTWDEAGWLAPSLRSIARVADQIVVGDNGSRDETPRILEELAGELGPKLEVLELPGLDIAALTNALLARARFRWVFRWDADFVAHTDGSRDIGQFRVWLTSLDPRQYFMVYPRMVELAGDLAHYDPAQPMREDAHCFVESRWLRYVYDAEGREAPRVPPWYGVKRFETPCFLHLNIKPDERLYRSELWKRWLGEARPTGERFADYLVRVGGRGEDLVSAARAWAQDYRRRLRPLDSALLPEYPALLRPFLDKTRPRLG
ncbi:MAG: glycosyltransferase [Candidatus Rokubacteria bacterium]|nr:glycosyltransferase [Candidatus Rokubacteria bacterium]MBI3827521.1 glycosyltransferase [Candidatus Rokubacteria bacterium]